MGKITNTKEVNINKLKPYENNAKIHDDYQVEKLCESIKEFGFLNPCIIDENYNVIAGHGRLMAAKEEGYKEVPVVFAEHLTEAQKKAYILADNRMAMDAGWDEDLLRIELEELEALDFNLALTGFDENELADFFKDEKSDVEDDDFDLSSALEEAAFVEEGDVWHVGRHTLMCGDATNESDVDTLMGDTLGNMILTDPPYNVAFESSDGLSIKNDKMASDKFYQFLLDAFNNMAKHLEKGGSAYIFHADTEGLNFRKAFIDAGFHLASCCLWIKNSLVLGRSDYQWQHEPILYGFLKNGSHKWYSDRSQTTLWKFDKPKKNSDHPTSKPLDLLAYPIGNSTQANAVVIDTFGGSGSTLMACEKTNRICYTMELDPKYASVILRRYVKDTGNADEVYVERNGEKLTYSDLVKEVDRDGNADTTE